MWRFFEANCEKLGWRAFIGHDHLLQFHFEEIEGRKSLDYCLQVTIPPEICAGKDFDFDSYKQGSVLEFPSEKSYFQSFEDGHFLYISPDFQDIEEKLKYLVRSMRVTLAAMKKGEGTEEGESSFQFSSSDEEESSESTDEYAPSSSTSTEDEDSEEYADYPATDDDEDDEDADDDMDEEEDEDEDVCSSSSSSRSESCNSSDSQSRGEKAWEDANCCPS